MLNHLTLRNPVWNGSKLGFTGRGAGIAKHLFDNGADVEVTITSKNADGVRLYPLPFFCSNFVAKQFGKPDVQGGVPLLVVPLSCMTSRELIPA